MLLLLPQAFPCVPSFSMSKFNFLVDGGESNPRSLRREVVMSDVPSRPCAGLALPAIIIIFVAPKKINDYDQSY